MNNNQIGLIDETNELSEEMMNLVGNVVSTAITVEGINRNVEVSITFVDDERIQELNKEYRMKDQPTDVLSFALNEGDEDEPFVTEGIPELLGDVIISVPRAVDQAKEYGHDLKRELCFLAVHGFLHLIGYDHDTEDREKKMFNKQEEILQKHGIKK
ncbi:rRNA maturation RNase YbeY [Evansella sp. AB-P1]|uniref:rRNA maturation RNase YbeY n=1 Tax=Evansella sp. AB-P1 TaxID=3037653 RepID=UPI0024201889|nr:rRNA maturation RNase YbeY [Evansella sp. AB-P1]MDG5786550.1 rRNA maturation RNase YbeY [Evansella sp. AB-P1]